jgi:hypothetical protein
VKKSEIGPVLQMHSLWLNRLLKKAMFLAKRLKSIPQGLKLTLI